MNDTASPVTEKLSNHDFAVKWAFTTAWAEAYRGIRSPSRAWWITPIILATGMEDRRGGWEKRWKTGGVDGRKDGRQAGRVDGWMRQVLVT